MTGERERSKDQVKRVREEFGPGGLLSGERAKWTNLNPRLKAMLDGGAKDQPKNADNRPGQSA